MAKYDNEVNIVDGKKLAKDSSVYLLYIANELAEANRLKREELNRNENYSELVDEA